jgi:hypothetical protein
MAAELSWRIREAAAGLHELRYLRAHTRCACPLGFGGILEFYSRRHIAARIDLGDTVVWYDSGIVIPAILGVGGSVVPGKPNQLPWNIGVSVWF